MSSRREVLVIVALAAAVTLGGYFVILPWLMPITVLEVLQGIALLSGIAFIPLIAWVLGPTLPSFLSEPLANLLFYLANMGLRTGVLVQRETDEYEIERVTDDLSPRSYWSRWAGARFGITFDATREAFEPMLIDKQPERVLEAMEPQDWRADGGTLVVDIDRGGRDWFASKDDVGKLLVPLGQKLAELRDVAGPLMGIEAQAEALKDHGGDTGEFGHTAMLVSQLVVFFGTMGMGYVIFF